MPETAASRRPVSRPAARRSGRRTSTGGATTSQPAAWAAAMRAGSVWRAKPITRADRVGSTSSTPGRMRSTTTTSASDAGQGVGPAHEGHVARGRHLGAVHQVGHVGGDAGHSSSIFLGWWLVAAEVLEGLGRAPDEAGLGEAGVDVGEAGRGQVVDVVGEQAHLDIVALRHRRHPRPPKHLGRVAHRLPQQGERRRPLLVDVGRQELPDSGAHLGRRPPAGVLGLGPERRRRRPRPPPAASTDATDRSTQPGSTSSMAWARAAACSSTRSSVPDTGRP